MKIGIVIVVAAVLALIFWACFFRSGGVAAADPNASQEPTQSEDQSETNEPVQSENPGETKDLYAQLDGAGVGEENAWLGAHVYLCSDGTFSVTVDYGGENVGIETDSGTWTKAEDGSLALTGTRDFTVQAADNGAGTITYTMEFVNAETGIPCMVTGTAAG